MKIRMNLITGVCTFFSKSMSVEKVLPRATMLIISYNLYQHHWFKDVEVSDDTVLQIDMWI